MHDSNRRLHVCDVCQENRECQDLFVTMRILEAEMAYSEDEAMQNRFLNLKRKLEAQGFAYPYGQVRCHMSLSLVDAHALQVEAQKLLEGLRRKLRLYS